MITHSRLLEMLNYDPETGRFIWKKGRSNRKAGDQAGSLHKAHGRMSARWEINIDNRRYLASRISWFYMTGDWPIFEIDHINTNSIDDSWKNLRQSNRQQNEINKGPYRNNRSGFKGVRFQQNGFDAAIRRNGKRRYLGRFDTAEQAGAAYTRAARQIDGEFLHDAR